MRRLPAGEAWLHEPKLDGWRAQAVKVGADVALYSRNGRDLGRRFTRVLDAMRDLPCRSVNLDCELVSAGPGGIDFYSLRRNRSHDVALIAFDILVLNGCDLRSLPLIVRKAHLQKLMAKNQRPNIGMVPCFDDGDALMLACMKHGFEGVVSKRKNAPYASGSRPEWVKVKSPTWRQANKDRWEVMQRP